MCLFSSRREPAYLYPLEKPRRSSRYSAHPPPGHVRVARMPRGSHEYTRRSSVSIREPVEYRRSRPREIEYVEVPRNRSRRRSVSVVRDTRDSRGSFYETDERRRSVSRVRY